MSEAKKNLRAAVDAGFERKMGDKKVYVDSSELYREIRDLERHNKVLQKADRYREKIWKKRVADLEAEKPECKWQQNNDDFDGWNLWSGQCGAEWNLSEGGPKLNTMNFCPECGGKLVELEQQL